MNIEKKRLIVEWMDKISVFDKYSRAEKEVLAREYLEEHPNWQRMDIILFFDELKRKQSDVSLRTKSFIISLLSFITGVLWDKIPWDIIIKLFN